MTAYEENTPDQVRELFVEQTDEEIAAELVQDWPPVEDDADAQEIAKARGEPDPYTIDELTTMFAELRADQSWLDEDE